jgi:glycosyltransferase involved in cell wall biosynthesis
MRLLVISHKEIWEDKNSPSGYSTIGGFPFQIRAISQLFNETILLLPVRDTPLPKGVSYLDGIQINIIPTKEPSGLDFFRKINVILWTIRYLKLLVVEISKADIVHILVPGDIGLIGLLFALFLNKKIFVRHCGTWNVKLTYIDYFLFWLLESIAGERAVVFATGFGESPPSKINKNIKWIFSTTLTQDEIKKLYKRKNHKQENKIILSTASRLILEKNTQAILQAMPFLLRFNSDIVLEIIGDGSYRESLEAMVENLNIKSSVRFHGNINHKDLLINLSQANFFIFPTNLNEGFPKVVIEAIACGLPVVASNVSCIPSIISNCGIVLSDTSPKTIANAIIFLLENPILVNKMIAQTKKTTQNFTLEQWKIEIKSALIENWPSIGIR